MNKYLAVARITLSNQLRYAFEYFSGLLRNLITLTTLYFLWTSAFGTRFELFGFTHQEIVSYIFMASLLRSLVLSTATAEIGSEIAGSGKFFYYLLKPVGYLKYWFTLDLVGKTVNTLSFLVIFAIIVNVFNINIIIASPQHLFLSIILVTIAIFMNFYIASLVSFTAFWTNFGWGASFLTMLLIEFLSGLYFPITVLPDWMERFVYLTPFPYLIYFPSEVLMGRLNIQESISVIFSALLWVVILYFLGRFTFAQGLRKYEAQGG